MAITAPRAKHVRAPKVSGGDPEHDRKRRELELRIDEERLANDKANNELSRELV